MDRHADARTDFRFELHVPRQDGHQLDAGDAGDARDAGSRRRDPAIRDSAVPAGYTYLGQFDRPRPELRPDEGRARPAARRSTALDQARSPALDLDSLYGGGPRRRRLAGFYVDGSGPLMETGPHGGRRRLSRVRRLRPARAARTATPARRASPTRATTTTWRVAQTHAAFIRFHNRVADERDDARATRSRGSSRPATSSRGTSSGSSGSTSCRGSATRRCSTTCWRTAGRPSSRARAATTRRRCRSSSPPASSASGTRWSGARTTGTAARPRSRSTTCSSTRAAAATSTGMTRCRAPAIADFRRLYDFTEIGRPRPRAAGAQRRAGDRHAAHAPVCASCRRGRSDGTARRAASASATSRSATS